MIATSCINRINSISDVPVTDSTDHHSGSLLLRFRLNTVTLSYSIHSYRLEPSESKRGSILSCRNQFIRRKGVEIDPSVRMGGLGTTAMLCEDLGTGKM